TVDQLVSNNGADCPEIRGVVRLLIEQGRLQDGRGESNRIELRIVVGVGYRGRYAPFRSIHGSPYLGELAVQLKFTAAISIAYGLPAQAVAGGIVGVLARKPGVH